MNFPAAFEPRPFSGYYAALADPVLMLVMGGFFLAMGASKFKLDRAMGRLLLRPFGTDPGRIMLGLMLITNGDRGNGARGGATEATEALLLTTDRPPAERRGRGGSGKFRLELKPGYELEPITRPAEN